MSLEWEQIVIDARDPVALGRWWLKALGWIVVNDDPGEFEIRPQADRLPGLIFEPVNEGKQGKNRLHLDLRPDDQHAEIDRLVALGASRVLTSGRATFRGWCWQIRRATSSAYYGIAERREPAFREAGRGRRRTPTQRHPYGS